MDSAHRFEDAVNRLADLDAGWWPFLRLRPRPHELLDNPRLLRIALHFGPPYGVLVFAWYVYIDFLPLSLAMAAACVLGAVAFFFVASKFTFAVFWNRRARRLRREGQPSKD